MVTRTNCAGDPTTIVLVFGSTSGSVPSQNIGSDPFFDSSNNGGIDIFFAGFKSDLTAPLQFGTNMGGSSNDYLGSTGVPRGANHLWVNGANVYVGTTVHSSVASTSPALVGGGGFDVVKDDGTNDTHIIFSIEFGSILESDYGDAPATYGTPVHTLNCNELHIGLLDPEAAAVPTVLANGDDLAGIDDEDGVATMPVLMNGGPQVINVTVDNIVNTTGSPANLYGWIDLNSDGQFQVGEAATVVTVANSFSGTKVLNWPSATVSGNVSNHYLRIRITTANLLDNAGTAPVDERSTVSALDGEVEDYRAIDLTCPAVTVVASCQTQAQINSAYSAWLGTATAGGGCNDGILTNNSPGAPPACGGVANVTFTYTSACAPITSTCASSFTVTADNTPPSITCPVNVTVQCANQVPASNPGAVTASDNCPGSTTVSFVSDVISNQTCANRYTVTRTYRATDGCGNSATCSQTITVFDNTAPSITCPSNVTVQCANLVPTPNGPTAGATDNCGGTSTVSFVSDAISNQTCANRFTVTRTYKVMDDCGNSATCNQIITVFDNTPPLTNCPADVTVQCASQVPTANGPIIGATDNCGGNSTISFVVDVITNQTCANRYVVNRTYRATDDCGNSATCNQLITVYDNTGPDIMCPSDVTVQCAELVPSANIEGVTATDNCGGGATISYVGDAISNQTCANRYTVTRTYSAVDVCGNTSTCNQTITVFDNTPPVCVTQNLTISIDQQIGFEVVTAAQIDNGSSDACGSVTLDLNPSTFTCANSGDNVVTLTVTDQCGNTSMCTATVTVLSCYNPCVTIDACVYLQGAAANPNGSDVYSLPMRTTLNNLRVLPGQTYLDPFFGTPHYTPPGEPYCAAPWNYCGTEGDGFDSGGFPGNAGYPATVVDWVLVSLRHDASNTVPLCQAAALLHNDGHLEFVEQFDCCNLNLDSSYYLVIEHRNHLIVMSDGPVPIVPGIGMSTLTYSFCTHQSYIDDPFMFGFVGQKLLPSGAYVMFAGNGDQTSSGNADVNFSTGDLAVWLSQNGTLGAYKLGDYNLNGDTNLNDRVVWERNNTKGTSVPR